jgi:ATP-dependent Lon protease
MVFTRLQKNKRKRSVTDTDSSENESDLSCISGDISEYESESTSESESKHSEKKNVKTPWKTHSRSNNINLKSKARQFKKRKKSKKSNSKHKKSKNDSDNSDIDIGECSSDEDYKEENPYQKFVDEVVDTMVDDAQNSIKIKKDVSRNKKWKVDLTPLDIKKYELEYDNICKIINNIPSVQNILKINMPFKTKCDLMEKVIILDNVQPDTFDHLVLKKSIRDELNKYKNSKITKKAYDQFTDIENKIEKSSGELPLKYKILGSTMSFKNKSVIYRKYTYLNTLTENTGEYSKIMNWINIALSLPNSYTPLAVSINDSNLVIAKFLYDVKYILNTEIYGMENVKEQILCILNNKITNPKLIGSSLGLVGVQGVGKTQIVNVLAKAINLSFTSISLGGATDSSFLNGHSLCYEGSHPGCIVDSLIQMKLINGIIFFDEIDKIPTTNYGQEISKSLLHITDFTQNHEFTDKYLSNEIKIDLSKLWFIYSLNYKDSVDKTLLDRLTLIEVDAYSDKQKKEMTIQYLLPAALKNIKMIKDDVSFSNEALDYIITETNKMYSHETQDKNGNSGVRKLKDIINSLVMKVNYLKNIILEDGTYGDLTPSFAIPNFKTPFKIEKEHVDKLKVITKQDSGCNHMYT